MRSFLDQEGTFRIYGGLAASIAGGTLIGFLFGGGWGTFAAVVAIVLTMGWAAKRYR